MILGVQNAIPSPAREALARREAAYAEEVRRLLDAGLAVMQRCGTTSRPRVADIVAEAGLSNSSAAWGANGRRPAGSPASR